MLINEDSSFSFVGTGFIISLHGLFISAGHVFKQGDFDEKKHFCIFPSAESSLIRITYLSINYKEQALQKGPTFYEFAVGKISRRFDNFIQLNKMRPQINEVQKIIGFRNINIETNLNRFVQNENETLNTSDLQYEELPTIVLDKFATIYNDLKDYPIGSNALPVFDNKRYNNCFTVKYRLHKGASGAPVFNEDNTLSGVYFGGFAPFSFVLATKFIKNSIRKIKKYRFNKCNISYCGNK